ncbi:cupin domain-containing protein [Bradyrhizobium icense]|uniref:Cupin type-2 domain-containing protein n=1 Tax=Bradyrhizobium icense TaxID=1274631 RepID=A0A1B1UEN8_9BRAD|nr:cupin domain-containing protein [Bradyrhizobium icense]ANW01219.1 hypothetical protein LMTR13_14640 [Bradyrhizobium icense]
MQNQDTQNRPIAHLVNWQDLEHFEILGPTIEFLTETQISPCIMRGTVPPGAFIPLHSHDDPETFVQISGEFEGLSEAAGDFTWLRIRPGDVFHVPPNARHAFRNRFSEPAVSIIVTTPKLAGLLKAISVPASVAAPGTSSISPERVRQALATAESFGYWNASPEENARVGLADGRNLP